MYRITDHMLTVLHTLSPLTTWIPVMGLAYEVSILGARSFRYQQQRHLIHLKIHQRKSSVVVLREYYYPRPSSTLSSPLLERYHEC